MPVPWSFGVPETLHVHSGDAGKTPDCDSLALLVVSWLGPWLW